MNIPLYYDIPAIMGFLNVFMSTGDSFNKHMYMVESSYWFVVVFGFCLCSHISGLSSALSL